MNGEEALAIVKELASGKNPQSGEHLESSSAFQKPETIRALFFAVVALERYVSYEKRRKLQPANTGKSWTDEEEQQLIAGFEDAVPFAILAQQHRRSIGALKARLVRLGKLEDEYVAQRVRSGGGQSKVSQPRGGLPRVGLGKFE